MMGQEFKDAFNQIGADDEMAELRREIEELKSLGQLSNLSDEAFEEDMRALDRDLKDGVDLTKDVSSKKADKPDVEAKDG